MYIIDKDGNQLIAAEATTFKEQKLKERQHLQEWIAKSPEVLGDGAKGLAPAIKQKSIENTNRMSPKQIMVFFLCFFI